MIKFRLVDKRTNVSRRIKELQDQLTELPKEFMRLTADKIIENSPVDTGTYMDSHNIGENAPVTNSRDKPRNQSKADYAEKARDRLYYQIDNLPFVDTKHYISNNSQHAWKVEYEGWPSQGPYSPYTIARASAPMLLDEAVRRVMKK